MHLSVPVPPKSLSITLTAFFSHLMGTASLAQIFFILKVEVSVAQLCLTLCNPMDFIVFRYLQVRILLRSKPHSLTVFRLSAFKMSGIWRPKPSNKESACLCRSLCSIPRSGRSPGEGNGNSRQYSYLENSMDRGGWRALECMELQRVRHDLATK